MARAAVIWDKAGERVMAETAPIQLYKNDTDNKGASYGCHENSADQAKRACSSTAWQQ